MANIVTIADFIGEINIPNTDKPDVSEELEGFIAKYEPRFLRKVLGATLYSSLITVLSLVDAEAEPPVTLGQRFIDLIDGKDYTNTSGYSVKFEGTKKAIANYVYYWYLRNKVSETTGTGEVVSKSENATRVSPGAKMTRAWNEMSEMIIGQYGYNDRGSLYDFLTSNPTVYTDWNETEINHWQLRNEFAKINTFSL